MRKRLLSMLLTLCMMFTMLPTTIMFTAQAADKTYTLYFDSKDGTPIDPITVTEGMLIPEPTPPTKEGFTFGGWYTDSTTKYRKWDFSKDTFVTYYNKLYARWEYAVHFELNGGTVLADVGALPNETIRKPNDPKREGYDFRGWYLDPTFKTAWDFSQKVTGNITLYAKWNARLNMVTFMRIDPLLGNYKYWQNQVATDRLVPFPTLPEKWGYTFDGWYKDFELTTRFNFAVDTVTKDTTLYDGWKPSTYTVTFDPKNGDKVKTVTGYYESKISEPAKPQKKGYIFGGWWQSGLAAPFDFSKSTVSSDIKLYAKWLTTDKVKVTFDTRGGSSISPVKIKYGSNVKAPKAPTRKGYVFDGWYFGDVNTHFFDFKTKLYEDITLKAKWIQYQPPASKGFRYEKNLNIFEQLRTDTYGLEQYLHIEDEDTGPIPKEIVSLAKSITKGCKNDYSKIKAISDWVSDNISYDYETYRGKANRSQQPLAVLKSRLAVCDGYSNLHVKMLHALKIPAVRIIGKAGKNFGAHAWSHAYLRSEDRWVIIDTTFNSTALTRKYFDISLEKITKDHEYTRVDFLADDAVSVQWIYNSDGKTVVDVKDKKLYRQKLKEPEKPQKVGYTFLGWYPASSWSKDATTWDFDKDIVKGDTILVARWELKNITISFDSNGGSKVESITAPFGTIHRNIPKPTRDGYKFEGWYYDTGFNHAWNSTVSPGYDTTFYAKWTKLPAITEGWYKIGLNGSYLNIAADGKGEIRKSDNPQYFYVKCTADDVCTIQTVDGTYVGNDKSITNGLQIKTVTNSYNWNVSRSGNKCVIRSVSKSDYILVASGGNTADGTPVVFSNSDAVDAHSQFIFTPVKATVTFNSNGGSAVEALTDFCGTSINKPANTTRNGYTFAGWYHDSAFKQPVTFPYTLEENTTFYAKWNANYFHVEFYTDHGTKVASQTISAGGKATKPANNPTSEYNTFGGWYKDGNFKTPWNFDKDTITKDTVIYAKWNLITYTAKFNSNGGSAVAAKSFERGSKVTEPKKPTRKGYTFEGWYTAKSGGKKVQFPYYPAGNVTLYAYWVKNPAVPKTISEETIKKIQKSYDQMERCIQSAGI